ncbi:uncharacterized protein C8Q71DRAFT_789036 [Rhodofomes roseus]|uniref:Uncharacterized protein n=1 Tax=Rhodofomes roseus TaxID=34475 RepID=A0ABQ8K0C2_9APHY|nr:uncharacterized protein C8Q71DRAFT_789036 [Rhodofomes roseus]KAH9829897.1 hypothetical protein C8Q71DRAFT_789036 [Rhodofomes roseus]
MHDSPPCARKRIATYVDGRLGTSLGLEYPSRCCARGTSVRRYIAVYANDRAASQVRHNRVFHPRLELAVPAEVPSGGQRLPNSSIRSPVVCVQPCMCDVWRLLDSYRHIIQSCVGSSRYTPLVVRCSAQRTDDQRDERETTANPLTDPCNLLARWHRHLYTTLAVLKLDIVVNEPWSHRAPRGAGL